MITMRIFLVLLSLSFAASPAWSMGGKVEEEDGHGSPWRCQNRSCDSGSENAGGANTDTVENTAQAPSAPDRSAPPSRLSGVDLDRCIAAVGRKSGVRGTIEAGRICSSYSADEIACAQRVDDRIDMDFTEGLDVCRNESSETIACAQRVGSRFDMDFKGAIPHCRKHSEETIACAQRKGDRIDMDFTDGIDFCVELYGFKPREGSRDKEELSAAVASGEADAGVYEHFQQKGLSHQEALALAKGPVLLKVSDAPSFLRRLSKHVYAHDRGYLDAAATMAEKEPRFVLLALRSYLENFPYRGVRDQFLRHSLPVITGNLEEISSKNATRTALRLLAASLQAAMPLVADGRKQELQQAITELGKAASTALSARDVVQMQDALPRIEAVVSSLVENSYLTARTRADLQLIRYLRGI
ncbi:MAG: hypothetical protein HUU37_03920 [Bdellovibrionales bacterium]|nr:hypothetical protein [Bdellovibrionales bacterium]